MKKEIIGNAQLYLGDCLEILPSLPGHDYLLSDPPYGIKFQHGGGDRGESKYRGRLRCKDESKRHRKKIHGDEKRFDPTPLLDLAPHILLFGADHFRSLLPDGGTFVAWDKSIGKGPDDSFVDAEFAWCNFIVKRNVIRYLWKGIACVKAGEDNGYRWHPTTKPQGVMNACLDYVPEAKTVIDPYMGSGSTGVAAVRRGLAFTGIEIDAEHFDTACRRIEDAQRQQSLIAEAVA